MDVFKRSRSLSSMFRSISFSRSPMISRRRNGISVDSYNELRKLLLHPPLPTTILQNPPIKEFHLNHIDLPFAASSYYILTFLNNCSTLILFNQDSELFRMDLHNSLILICDLCWSSKLNLFVMGGYSLYTFNPRSYQLTTIEQTKLIRGEWIVSITSDNHSIYLLYSSRGTRIQCRSIYFPHTIEKQWLEKDFLREKDFLAQCIRINEWNIIAMTIKQKNSQWRVDLFHSTNLSRIHRGCSLGQSIPGMRNCLLMPYNRLWIVINNCSIPGEVILLDENGRMKDKIQIDKSNGLFNLCLIGNEWIGMTLKDKLRFYKIQ